MTQTIVITGATGVIGRRAVAEFVAAGHDVTGIARSARGRALLHSLGARAAEADVFDEAQLARAFAAAGAVVNLLTHLPRAEQMHRPDAWEENDRLRTQASRAIARAATAAGAARLIQESVGLLYADGGARRLEEDAPFAPAGASASALTAERNARAQFAGETVVLRFGLFVGPDSALSQANVAAARAGRSTFANPPGAYVPTVWLDDAGAAVAAALEAPAGAYNVVDDDPPTRAELDAALAAAVGRRRLEPLPPGDDPLSRSLRLSNRKLRERTGWAPRTRGGTEGWAVVAAEAAAA
jgi:nucleoside-diphosphate-sugar epimerase